MKRLTKIITPVALSLSVGLIATVISCYPNEARAEKTEIYTTEQNNDTSKKKIKIALLLDTSGSMSGLINQAKSQLWSLVNELSTANCDGEKPELQLALYHYGNQGLSSKNGYVQQISAFTGELDEISSQLFALTTNGGEEYCGQVIQAGLNELEWGSNESDLKFIFIAGNEPFDQGSVDYVQSCANARDKDIVVNTIFCGNFQEGINSFWKNGATIAHGDYMSIDHNQQTVYVPTPYDSRLDSLNTRLNDTYIYYGNQGKSKFEKQAKEDRNAQSISYENKVNRAVSKGGSFYRNDTWDLVDKTSDKDIEEVLEHVDESTLPTEMKALNETERIAYVEQKSKERVKIQTEIARINTKRKTYIAKNSNQDQTNLNSEMMRSIKKKAATKNYTF